MRRTSDHPGFYLRPQVIDPFNTPDDGSPYLSIFAAFMWTIALEADRGVRAYLRTIRESGASTPSRPRLETMMTTMKWKSDFIDGFIREGLHKGAAKAKAGQGR